MNSCANFSYFFLFQMTEGTKYQGTLLVLCNALILAAASPVFMPQFLPGGTKKLCFHCSMLLTLKFEPVLRTRIRETGVQLRNATYFSGMRPTRARNYLDISCVQPRATPTLFSDHIRETLTKCQTKTTTVSREGPGIEKNHIKSCKILRCFRG